MKVFCGNVIPIYDITNLEVIRNDSRRRCDPKKCGCSSIEWDGVSAKTLQVLF